MEKKRRVKSRDEDEMTDIFFAWASGEENLHSVGTGSQKNQVCKLNFSNLSLLSSFVATLSTSSNLPIIQPISKFPYPHTLFSPPYKPFITKLLVSKLFEIISSISFSSSPQVMAATASSFSVSASATVASPARLPRLRSPKVHYIKGLNPYTGLKAHNLNATVLNLPVCPQRSFANKIYNAMNKQKGNGGGGALSAACSAVGEIFKIAAIMNGLTLVGVAVGFVLLRIEATVEESE